MVSWLVTLTSNIEYEAILIVLVLILFIISICPLLSKIANYQEEKEVDVESAGTIEGVPGRVFPADRQVPYCIENDVLKAEKEGYTPDRVFLQKDDKPPSYTECFPPTPTEANVNNPIEPQVHNTII